MNARAWTRWTVKSLKVAAMTGLLAWSVADVGAQYSPQNSARPVGVKKTFTRNTTFNLPIQMEEVTRATLAEVHLYVKTGTGDWARQEVASPYAQHFTYRVPGDGEYWFSLVTVDKSGRQSPTDINSQPPALRVVVDTRPPQLDTNVAMESGDPILRVNVVDANPDPQSIRAMVLSEAGERAITPLPGQAGVFRLNPADVNLPIRVTASDLSGNLATRDIVARDSMAMAQGGQPGTLPSITPPPPQMTQSPYIAPPPLTTAPSVPAPAISNGGISTTAYRPAGMDNSDKPANRKLINTTRAQIEYRIDTVGPSGIGRVDIYLTSDRGQTWNKVGEDPNKKSPLSVELPGEGLFGVRLAITNGNGFGGRPPRSGDRPSFFIEVDATSPQVQLLPFEMAANSGAIDLRWQASDANMGPEPVSIFYRARLDAPWQPIARNFKNDGVYRWTFPRDIGAQLFFKLEVVDLAGNMTKVETPTPFLLDQTEPEATLVDAVGVNQRPQGMQPTQQPSVPSQPIQQPFAPSLPPYPGR